MSTLARFDPPRPGVSLLRFLALSLLIHAFLLIWLGRSPLTSDWTLRVSGSEAADGPMKICGSQGFFFD